MSHRYQAGRATGSLLILLLVMMGGGGWNYYRNLQLEKATESDRPFRSYAVEDLESLRAAYASELKGVQANFASAKRRRARPQRDVGSIAGNVEQFANTTRASSAIREAAAGVVERQEQVEQLDRELEIRSQLGQGLARHIKLLTTI